jgi:hypothetical protein
MSEQKEQIAQERFGKSFDELESERILRVDLAQQCHLHNAAVDQARHSTTGAGCPSLFILPMHVSCLRFSGKCIWPPLAAIIK